MTFPGGGVGGSRASDALDPGGRVSRVPHLRESRAGCFWVWNPGWSRCALDPELLSETPTRFSVRARETSSHHLCHLGGQNPACHRFGPLRPISLYFALLRTPLPPSMHTRVWGVPAVSQYLRSPCLLLFKNPRHPGCKPKPAKSRPFQAYAR
jgi:hypothetical protein